MKKAITTYIRLSVLVLAAGSMAVPFCWMVLTSFKPMGELDQGHFLPRQWDTGSYPALWSLSFGRWYFNSLLVAGWVTFLQLVTSAMSAFAFSRLRWPGRDKVFFLYLGTLMVPGLILIIPNFYVMVKLHLVNTYLGLVLPASFTAFGTFLLRQFMLTVPMNLDEAAEIDGAGKFRVFTDIVLPLIKPGLVTLAVFAFIGNFGSFFWPLIMIKDEALHTLPIGMLYFSSNFSQQTNLLMAAAVLNLLPPIIVFILLQRFLVRGIQISGG